MMLAFCLGIDAFVGHAKIELKSCKGIFSGLKATPTKQSINAATKAPAPHNIKSSDVEGKPHLQGMVAKQQHQLQ